MFTLTKQDAEDYLDIYRGEYQDFYYPEGAVDTDTSTWGTFTFSE